MHMHVQQMPNVHTHTHTHILQWLGVGRPLDFGPLRAIGIITVAVARNTSTNTQPTVWNA